MEAKAKEPDPELARLRDENERLKQQVHASNAEAGAEKTASVTAPAKASEPKAPPQPAQRVEESSLRTLLFGADKASMTAESKQSLAPVVTALKGNPAQRVVLEGYSDSKGSDSYNQKISQKRSDAVKIFLVQSGVKPERISSRGLGEANPVATNATEDGRRRNRRVEVMIVEDQRTASGPVQ
jgi:OOP family OmpA-OmpF porin